MLENGKTRSKNRSSINRYLGLFLVNAISFSSSGKYGYGYKFSQSRIVRQKILLPITEDGEPDYAYMEAYMRLQEQKQLKRYLGYLEGKQ